MDYTTALNISRLTSYHVRAQRPFPLRRLLRHHYCLFVAILLNIICTQTVSSGLRAVVLFELPLKLAYNASGNALMINEA